jgi:hypothetical protein
VLAVKADSAAGTATIGSQPGSELAIPEILAALESIGYQGQLLLKTNEKGDG